MPPVPIVQVYQPSPQQNYKEMFMKVKRSLNYMQYLALITSLDQSFGSIQCSEIQKQRRAAHQYRSQLCFKPYSVRVSGSLSIKDTNPRQLWRESHSGFRPKVWSHWSQRYACVTIPDDAYLISPPQVLVNLRYYDTSPCVRSPFRHISPFYS